MNATLVKARRWKPSAKVSSGAWPSYSGATLSSSATARNLFRFRIVSALSGASEATRLSRVAWTTSAVIVRN